MAARERNSAWRWRVAGACLSGALLAACSSAPPVPPAQPAWAPPLPRMAPPAPANVVAPPAKPVEKPVAAAPMPAVLALLNEAQAARDAGNLDEASATLERALRVQPKHALLWYRLAELRLRQEKPQMAVDLALKSKLLAGTDHALVQQNWALIAEAKRRLGDTAGALEAERQAAGQP